VGQSCSGYGGEKKNSQPLLGIEKKRVEDQKVKRSWEVVITII
jgi:hypothetical protein